MSEALASSYQKRKCIVLFGSVAILLIIAAWLFIIKARAEDEDPSDLMQGYENTRDFVGREIADGLITSIDAIFDSEGEGDTSQSTPPVNEFFRGVKGKIEGDQTVKTATSIVMGVALVLVMLYSFIELFKELQRGDGGMDLWAKFFVVASISVICVVNYEMIFGAAEDLGKYILDRFIGLKDTSAKSGLYEWIAGKNSKSPFYVAGDLEEVGWLDLDDLFYNFFFTAHVYLMTALVIIVLVAMEIPLMAARIALLTLLIELVVRKAFFPMAMASVCTGGMRSPGVAYIKKLLGVYVRLSMCVLIAIIGDLIVSHLLNFLQLDLIHGIMRGICIFVVYTTCTKLFANTSSLANSIVGVH